MKDTVEIYPQAYKKILEATNNLNFDQASDSMLGSFLTTLSATKPNGNYLELGTGSGLSTAWILQGMDAHSSLKTIDNNEELVDIAKKYLGKDQRVQFILGEGEELILDIEPNSIDFIFADTWPGKYNHLDETLLLLKQGGIYLIDDMLPQENWPKDHAIKANNLVQSLENREDLLLTKMCWSTGIVICTKIA
jgi:predicted O-methyltransferase YrrM